MKPITVIVVLMLLFAASCGVAEGPREKLKHSAFLFNEGLRWNRHDEVLSRVDPKALEHFTQMHQGWGDILRLENAEVIHSAYDSDAKKALITVKFTWYKVTEMLVHSTITVQHWEYRNATWIMMAEEFKSGTPF